jgi:hypothetical protein
MTPSSENEIVLIFGCWSRLKTRFLYMCSQVSFGTYIYIYIFVFIVYLIKFSEICGKFALYLITCFLQ